METLKTIFKIIKSLIFYALILIVTLFLYVVSVKIDPWIPTIVFPAIGLYFLVRFIRGKRKPGPYDSDYVQSLEGIQTATPANQTETRTETVLKPNGLATTRRKPPEVDAKKKAGDHGEELLQSELQRLIVEKRILGFVTSENIVYKDKNFELDFLIFVPHVGLVLAEVKYFAGQIQCSNAMNWIQTKLVNGIENRKEIKNPSGQVLRTTRLLRDLLYDNGLNRWPIHPVVLLAHPSAIAYVALEPDRPQSEVIKLAQLDDWLLSLPSNEAIAVSEHDIERVSKLVHAHEAEYHASAFA